MNDDLTPFEPDQLDEILSAELDGELEDAAHDFGLTVDEVVARLQATPGADARRRQLAAAHDVLAAPVELDDLVAQRLLTTARRGAEASSPASAAPSRRSQWFLRTAGIAAAIAALVAVAFSIGGNHSNDRASKSSSVAADSAADNSSTHRPTTTLGSAAPGPSTALGAFNSVHDLAQAAVDRGRRTTADAVAPSAAFGNAAGATSTQTNSAKSTERLATKANGALGFECAVPPEVPIRATAILRATATLAGKPVVVRVYEGNGEHIVVVQDTNCALVNVQMLG